MRDRHERWFDGAPNHCENLLCEGGSRVLAAHHVCYKQHVVAARGDVWDPRNRLVLCATCHTRHHAGGEGRLKALTLRPENYVFAAELLGPGAAYEYVRRRYRGRDVRLGAMLAAAERAA